MLEMNNPQRIECSGICGDREPLPSFLGSFTSSLEACIMTGDGFSERLLNLNFVSAEQGQILNYVVDLII